MLTQLRTAHLASSTSNEALTPQGADGSFFFQRKTLKVMMHRHHTGLNHNITLIKPHTKLTYFLT